MKKCVFLTMVAALVLSGSAIAQGFPDVYYYKFDAGAGTNITNWANPSVAPYWHNGVGGLWETTGAPVGTAAMNFNSQDFLHMGVNAGIDRSQSYTIEMWMRTNTVNPYLVRLFSDYYPGTFRCYVSFYNSGNAADYTGDHLDGVGMNPGTGAVVDDGLWHHIALVFDATAGTATSYVDGVLDYTSTVPVLPGGVGTNGQLGGNDASGGAQNVAVDEFRVWQSARTQTEIVNNMNITLTPSIPTPVFTATPVSGATPLIVSFTDLSTAPAGSSIISWAWDMENDGIVDYTVPNPCHAFTSANTAYDVTLTVDDGSGPVSATYVGYINTGNPDFVMGTCGNGDLYLGAPPPPSNWPVGADGFTILSATQAGPVGSGSFFGMQFDTLTLWGLLQAPSLGNPLHFVNPGPPAPPVFPFQALSFPAGLFVPGSGIGFDAVVVYRDSLGLILIDPVTSLPAISGIARIVF